MDNITGNKYSKNNNIEKQLKPEIKKPKKKSINELFVVKIKKSNKSKQSKQSKKYMKK